jgi:hypothetical protein
MASLTSNMLNTIPLTQENNMELKGQRMSKKNKYKNEDVDYQEISQDLDTSEDAEQEVQEVLHIENKAPLRVYTSFEEFWFTNVKSKDTFLVESCKSHLKALGWLHDQSKWREGCLHFGLKIVKD